MTDRFDLPVEEVTAMVQAASQLALTWFRRAGTEPLAVENKLAAEGRFDPVTVADRAVEDALRAALLQRFPEHLVYGEERGVSGNPSSAYRWVIDPIDGTRAFVTGQPQWGTLLGLQRGDDVLAGWLHQPTLGHTYVGAEGHAALHEGSSTSPLRVSGQTDLEDAILLCTHPEMFTPGEEATSFARIQARVRMTRFSGDCLNYGYVATGYADLVIEADLQPYDVIPLIPIIERAGGVITDREGRPPLAGGWAIGAATPELHRAALDLLNE
ncbi:MAG: histidinol-phosphatase [Actinomycetota bacterium]|nr:histidinol-phosphatase [Actinomycetota bacterium]